MTASEVHVLRPIRAFMAMCASKDFPSSFATGVGNKPDPISPVGSANGGSGNTVPLRIIPERSEAPEHLVQSARAKGWDVFDDDPARARFLDDAEVFEPQAGTLSAEAGATAGDADVLAGEASADEVGNNSICAQSLAGDGSNVVINRHSRPMLRQDLAAERLDFAEGNGGHPSPL